MSIDKGTLEIIRNRVQAAREMIDVEETIKWLKKVIDGTVNPTKPQLEAAKILLAKSMPDLKAIEHTQAPKRPETREELIERIAKLHAGAIAGPQPRAADGTAGAEREAEVRH